MIKKHGIIKISPVQSMDSSDVAVRISSDDGTYVVDTNISMHDLAAALITHTQIPCEFEIGAVALETKTETLSFPKRDPTADEVKNAAEYYEIDGWQANLAQSQFQRFDGSSFITVKYQRKPKGGSDV